ncbi:hypothetical protein ANN_23730 [Periplaneta americana]|uniref:Uncharacterized protein n=1 Tax=Periplaneta americana TaxID=6978 RepID=A0ABQ8SMU2_PERAM|nr:hypothetical protein ANN_23730 [Periplaneta americana]
MLNRDYYPVLEFQSLMLARSEFQSLGRAIVKEVDYEEVRWDGIVRIVSWCVFRLWWEDCVVGVALAFGAPGCWFDPDLGRWHLSVLRNADIRKQTHLKDAAETVDKLKKKWAGHVMRLNANRWTHILTTWDPRIGKHNAGRQKTRWTDFDQDSAIYGQEQRKTDNNGN